MPTISQEDESINNFAKIFLIQFTKELINNSKTKEILKIESKKKEHELENLTVDPISPKIFKKIQKPIHIIPKKPKIKLTIPEILLPQRFQYLQPVPTQKEIGIGKLNQMIKNPTITTIKCAGPNSPITIKTTSGGFRQTNISLTKEDINKIIETFSKESKIPIQEGIYKVVAGKLILSAIISNIAGSQFIIQKIQLQKYRNPIR